MSESRDDSDVVVLVTREDFQRERERLAAELRSLDEDLERFEKLLADPGEIRRRRLRLRDAMGGWLETQGVPAAHFTTHILSHLPEADRWICAQDALEVGGWTFDNDAGIWILDQTKAPALDE